MPIPDDPLRSDTTAIDLVAHTLTLEQLLDGARQGLRGHIGELYRRYGPDLLRKMQFEDETTTADVIMTDVFLKLPHALQGYVHKGKFEAWLWVIAKNMLTDRRRQRQRLPEPVADPGEGVASPWRVGHSFERADLIEQLASCLTPDQRDVWLLNLQGFGDKDTAERLGIKANNVAQILYRARGRVREKAQEMGLRRSDLLDSWVGSEGP
jgi:RNA polymerase sigma factor (sigma-70 family)